jgi:hypothetical protein
MLAIGKTGECIFLPKFKPHAFIIRSPRLRMLTLFTPGGLEEAFRSMNSPAQNLGLPTGAFTYSTAHLKHTAQRLSEYGVRLPAPDEVPDQLPCILNRFRRTQASDQALELNRRTPSYE